MPHIILITAFRARAEKSHYFYSKDNGGEFTPLTAGTEFVLGTCFIFLLVAINFLAAGRKDCDEPMALNSRTGVSKPLGT